ncbi:branched-chain amino acid ABC transporter permease [Pseudorhodoferax sp.]|uniref:branched-chain amino acid ABC transporter permease n=1 Tax=Pseudorhodoferax sp. TaxID=1993553 RepID=UPI002DD6258A|nr:branched-chain amino acid ABC transporter permease [Pseudorhodoferax sp.]
MDKRSLGTGLVVLALLLAPVFLPGYASFQLTQTIGLALALVGLNVLMGWGGQPSLGQGAFFAIGAYAAAMLMQTGLPWWLGVPAAGLVAAAAAWLIGKPILRLEQTYLALATFAMALAVPQLLRFGAWERWVGGAAGLQLDRPAPPAWLPAAVTQDVWMYWIALGVAAAALVAVNAVLRGRLGLDLRAVRDHATAANACGIDVARTKTLAFVLCAACGGLGGALYALNVQLVTPDSFTIFLSLTLVVGLTIGGPGTLAGPLVGALFVQFVPMAAGGLSNAAPWTVFGLAVLLVIFVEPRGLVGLWQRVRPRAAAARRQPHLHSR